MLHGPGDRDQTVTLITILTEADMMPLKLMPLRFGQYTMEIQWDEVGFNDTKMDRLPEQGIGTYMTDTRRSYKQSLVRWSVNI